MDVENWVPAIVILAAFLLLILYMVSSDARARKKSRRLMEDSFGRIPFAPCDPESAAAYHEARCAAGPSTRRIDAGTWDDLDMDRVFLRLDGGLTSVGDEVLYDRLHEPCFSEKPLLDLERLMGWMDEHPEERAHIREIMNTLGRKDFNGLCGLLFRPEWDSLPLPWLYLPLSFLPPLALLLLPLSFAWGLFALSAAVTLNIVVYFLVRRRIESELSVLRYLAALLWCCDKICAGPLGGLEWFIGPLRDALVPLRPLRGKLSGAARAAMARSDADTLLDIFRAVFLADLRAYRQARKLIETHTAQLRLAYERFGTLDMAIGLLSFRKSMGEGWCAPGFFLQNRLEFEDLTHPLLLEPVPNSGTFDRSCLLTGSNASGKSTFLKALAINALLAQTVHTCTAAAFRSRFLLVVSSMAVRDDVTSGDSYFVTELKSLLRILDAARGEASCLCVIDEILRGTNTVERIAASSAVLGALAETDCLCIAATHDGELTGILGGRVDNYHFREQITGNGVKFDYKLRPGPSRTHNAILLLGQLGFSPDIVADANDLVRRYEISRRWPAAPL